VERSAAAGEEAEERSIAAEGKAGEKAEGSCPGCCKVRRFGLGIPPGMG